jgi:hypothetical protein
MTNPQSPSERAGFDDYRRRLGVYGAARERWPAEARALYDRYAGATEGAQALSEAGALDAALALADAPKADDRLKDRLMADYIALGRKPRAKLRVWSLRLLPSGAAAALSAAGFFAGAATAQPRDDALYYAEAAVASAFDEGGGLWPVE